ncbi:uncharacterized protein LOC127791720 [Diospyros lotus]|uniref:uncharacterized protein LOC127791720 n=1 Tax=Diospyros lotus TaxID=55363 RepID=UPI00224C9275|nr:uncharacterized protein LOC127791720 [Diospyros lotus]
MADLRQEVSELRGTMATMLRHFENFMAHQGRQEQAPPGRRNEPVMNENVSGQTANPVSQEVEPQGMDDNTRSQLVRNFMTLRPSEFHRGTNALVAKEWMMVMEKHLRTIGGPTWAEFRELFNANYFSAWVRDQKTYEFIELTQGNKTMAQYEEEFTSLARFAPKLVCTEEKKATKFQRGLRVDIRFHLAGAQITDYAILVQRAHIIENEMSELRAVQATATGSSSARGQGNDKKRKGAPGFFGNIADILPCTTCGKRHRGVCKACYSCGQLGHMKNDYPQGKGITSNKEVTCYRCGRKGHTSNVCRQSPQQGGQRYENQGNKMGQRQPVSRL